MTLQELVPIITALLAVGGGALAYWNQKRIDRREDLIELRRSAYNNLILSIIDLPKGGDSLDQMNRLRMQISVVGSDRVLRSLTEFNRFTMSAGPLTNETIPEFKERLANVIYEMRRDVFSNTDLAPQDIKSSLPMNG